MEFDIGRFRMSAPRIVFACTSYFGDKNLNCIWNTKYIYELKIMVKFNKIYNKHPKNLYNYVNKNGQQINIWTKVKRGCFCYIHINIKRTRMKREQGACESYMLFVHRMCKEFLLLMLSTFVPSFFHLSHSLFISLYFFFLICFILFSQTLFPAFNAK